MPTLIALCGGVVGLLVCVPAQRGVVDHKGTPPRAIQVFCGAGLMHPMEELCCAFEAEAGLDVQVSYGGAGVLLGRLSSGRPCDVFIPGAARSVEDAARNGWVDAGSRVDVARHVPVIAVSQDGSRKVAGLEDLARSGVRVGLGDPVACAIGEAADEILERSGLAERAADNVCVRTPTVNQLLLYLVTDHIDAAIIWEDMIHLPEAAGKVTAIPIPPSWNAVRTIAAAQGTRPPRAEQAAAFIEFMTSARAREIWKKWGFTPCGE